MRREGRQRGWVRVYDRAMVDPEGKRRGVHVVDGSAAAVVANGGYIRASRKPTNQSKSGGLRRALARSDVAGEGEQEVAPQVVPPYSGYGRRSGYYYSTTWQSPFRLEDPDDWRWRQRRYEYEDSEEEEESRFFPAATAAPRFAGRASFSKGSRKFRHDEMKAYYRDAADDVDGQLDYLHDLDS